MKHALGHFAKGTTLFAEVDDYTNAATLGATHTLLNGEDQIGFAVTTDLSAIILTDIYYKTTHQVQISEPKTSEPLPMW
jgi:hypothetical protein